MPKITAKRLRVRRSKDAPWTDLPALVVRKVWAEETDPTVPDWAKQPDKPTYTAKEVGALPADTKIPAKTSDLFNDSGFVGEGTSALKNYYTKDDSYSRGQVDAMVPSKVSSLTNDSGFITKAVGDLVNYYTKSQTYTRDEIQALVSSIPKFSISVVSFLPTMNISTTTVYLLKSGSGSDMYTEYIYVNGVWEVLGSQRVDLTGYATETWVSIKLADYMRMEDLQVAVDTALAVAKASGEFDGKDGKDGTNGTDGRTPVKSVDYFTPEEVQEIVDEAAEKAAELVEVEVDDTLTKAGQAADAAAVGEVVNQLSETIANQNDIISGLQAGAYIDYDVNVKAINHRGYSTEAPENTIPAYIMSKKKGFKYVECDVAFTSDNVAVLLHDTTIDRTSDGSGNISSLTYADVLQYDFGSWKSTEYTGTTIPTFEEFIMLCKAVGLHPYIELKSSGAYTEAQIEGIVATVKAYGMEGKVTYISFNANFLSYVKNADSKARLGYLEDVTVSTITTALGLKTAENNVFMDVSYNNVTDEKIALCVANALPLEIWTVNSESVIQNMDAYITGVTSDNLIAGKILYNKYMEYIAHEKPDTPTKTLTSISATYSGGDVAVGTALTALTGIVVTATYSDGSTVAVTGYTLSGEIVEGNNTIIVTYQGMTASFTVTGVSESGDGEDTTLLYNWDFRNSNMTDSVHGETATGSVTASADGIIFKSSQHVRLLNQSYNMQDKTIEIDVVSREGGDEIVNYYCRLFCIGSSNSSATHTKTAAFLWGQSARKWSFYSGSAWADTYDATLGVGALVGKTVQLYFDNDMYCHLYINGDYFGKSSLPSDYTDGWLFMGGSASDNLYMAANVISGVRIYRGNKAAPNL